MENLVHLVYASQASGKISREEVEHIIQTSMRNNKDRNITGMLLYAEGTFFQVLEGDREQLEDLYIIIKADIRHQQIVKIYEEPIDKRYFGDWSMGLASLDHKELSRIPGCRDFFQSGKALLNMSPNRAKLLLNAFRRGEWRNLIH